MILVQGSHSGGDSGWLNARWISWLPNLGRDDENLGMLVILHGQFYEG